MSSPYVIGVDFGSDSVRATAPAEGHALPEALRAQTRAERLLRAGLLIDAIR